MAAAAAAVRDGFAKGNTLRSMQDLQEQPLRHVSRRHVFGGVIDVL